MWIIPQIIVAYLFCGPLAPFIPPPPFDPAKMPYDIGFRSVGKGNLDEVELRWAANGRDYMAGAGFLSPGGTKTNGLTNHPPPIPEKATLTWKSPDGKHHKEEVAIRALVPDPNHFYGTIWIKFMPDGTPKVKPMSWDEMRAMQYWDKEYP